MTYARSALMHASLQVTVLAKKGDLASFLSSCSSKGASSGACAVLVTDKASTPSVFKALAAEFEGRLGFAAARKGAQELVSELGLTKCVCILAHTSGAACHCTRCL